MQVLVRTGLLRLVRPGARPGHADEYQLTIPADLLDRDDIEVWSPARQRLEIERVREQTRGRYTRKDLQVPEGPAGKQTGRSRTDQQTPCPQALQGTGAPP